MAAAVITVAAIAAVISYQHAYQLVRSHGESGLTARLLPFTVDGLMRSGPRRWWYWTPAAGASRYHGWPRQSPPARTNAGPPS
jgi:Protein of unknown function (DUF2637)